MSPILARLADAPQLLALSRLELLGAFGVSPTVLPRFIARFQSTLESLRIQSATVAEGHVEGHIRDVLRWLATRDWPALRCITVNICPGVYFCPRLLFK